MGRELRTGDEMPARRFVIDDWRLKVFSLLMRDPNPIHFDAAAVAALGRGDRPVAQGTLTVAYLIDALVEWLGGDDAVGRIARVSCRFSGSAYAGDTVHAGGRVAAVDDVATVEIWLSRDGERLVTGSATVRPPTLRG